MSGPAPTPERPTGWLFSPDKEKLRAHMADCDPKVLFERQGSGQHAWYKCSSCGVLVRHTQEGEESFVNRRCTGKAGVSDIGEAWRKTFRGPFDPPFG